VHRRHLASPRSFFILILLSLGSFLPANSIGAQVIDQGEVKSDTVPVYSQMSRSSSVVKTLSKGDRVHIRLRVAGVEGAWCKVAELGQSNSLGFVLCSKLLPASPPQASNSTSRGASGPPGTLSPCVDAPAPRKLEGSGRIYFAPVGDFPLPVVDYLRDCYKRRFGLDIRALAPLVVESSAMDPHRGQLIAERLLAQITQRYSKEAAQPGVTVVGLTTQDMYARNEPNWQFVFGWRQSRYSVVSTARFAVPYYDGVATEAVVLSRLRKAVGRYLGFLYYGLPPSAKPKSMLYPTLLGIDDLDALGEDF
jgi:predicted Zn-dependent protease